MAGLGQGCFSQTRGKGSDDAGTVGVGSVGGPYEAREQGVWWC